MRSSHASYAPRALVWTRRPEGCPQVHSRPAYRTPPRRVPHRDRWASRGRHPTRLADVHMVVPLAVASSNVQLTAAGHHAASRAQPTVNPPATEPLIVRFAEAKSLMRTTTARRRTTPHLALSPIDLTLRDPGTRVAQAPLADQVHRTEAMAMVRLVAGLEGTQSHERPLIVGLACFLPPSQFVSIQTRTFATEKSWGRYSEACLK